MAYIAEDGMEYKCRTEYWKTLYPMRKMNDWKIIQVELK